ncbi:hypothetical protein D3C83_257390 [compost metagenome]
MYLNEVPTDTMARISRLRAIIPKANSAASIVVVGATSTSWTGMLSTMYSTTSLIAGASSMISWRVS